MTKKGLPSLLAGVCIRGMAGTQFHIQPAVHQFLQTSLAAKMLCQGIMRQHVFPRVNLEHVAFPRFRMGTIGLAPGEPPVVNSAFLLSADIAIKSFSPGPRRDSILRSDFLHER